MTRYRNLGLFLFLAAIWGAAFMAIKAGLEFFPPVLFAAIRYDIAGVVMLAYAVYATDHWLPRTRSEVALVTAGSVLMIGAYHALLFVGETDPGVTSAVAAVVVSLSPVLTAGFSRLFFPDEPLRPAAVVGLVLGLLGVAILQGLDLQALLTGGSGVLMVFLAAAAFALGSVLTRVIDAQLPIETMQAWSMLGGALFMHGVSLALPSESLAAIQWTTDALLALGYLSLVASAVGFLIYFDLLERVGPVEINLVSYVAPVFAALSGWLVLDESVSETTVVGFLVIFTGFVLIKRQALLEEFDWIREVLG